MNFGKLLATGRSFIGGNGQKAYRADKHFYLPKFNSPKNPWQQTAKPVAPKTGAQIPQMTSKPAESVKPVYSAAKSASSESWAERLNPFSRLRQPEPLKNAPTPVQTELSLDTVKVLHNDLTDADVEIVPIKSRSLSILEEPQEAKGSVWARLENKFLEMNAA